MNLKEQLTTYKNMTQVTPTEEKYVNHTAITHIYGRLISYASLFRCWSNGIINKAPVIFEMDTPNAYEITLNTFQQAKKEIQL